jgi:hypothetical protein
MCSQELQFLWQWASYNFGRLGLKVFAATACERQIESVSCAWEIPAARLTRRAIKCPPDSNIEHKEICVYRRAT